jgi:hypothetical protein
MGFSLVQIAFELTGKPHRRDDAHAIGSRALQQLTGNQRTGTGRTAAARAVAGTDESSTIRPAIPGSRAEFGRRRVSR